MPINLPEQPLCLQGIKSRLMDVVNISDVGLINLVGGILLHVQILRVVGRHRVVPCDIMVWAAKDGTRKPQYHRKEGKIERKKGRKLCCQTRGSRLHLIYNPDNPPYLVLYDLA